MQVSGWAYACVSKPHPGVRLVALHMTTLKLACADAHALATQHVCTRRGTWKVHACKCSLLLPAAAHPLDSIQPAVVRHARLHRLYLLCPLHHKTSLD